MINVLCGICCGSIAIYVLFLTVYSVFYGFLLSVMKPCINILTTLNILPVTKLIVHAFDSEFVLNCVHRFHGELMVLITKVQDYVW